MTMPLRVIAAAVLGALMCSTAATAQTDASPAPAESPPAPTLTRQDLDSWLDGFMPYALTSNDIAGAVVVVVRDGQVLTEKGYGFADMKARRKVDPQTTLFRPGSISKLFTWTAVMQLLELGRLDLDGDINAYLDFMIPPRDGQPITLRNLMTHTAGFEEHAKGTLMTSPERLPTLGGFVKASLPARVYPPGEVPAYSNYGSALAGYVVERISGEPFDDYVDHHILGPLGMTNSTFRQPLPEAMKPNLAEGYSLASEPPRSFEFIGPGPAGSLTTTGIDMGRFMIAHLQNGRYGDARILQEATAEQMHAPQKQLNPPLPPMALGFYHEDRNGHRIIGHGGDTVAFHSDLHLLLDDNVGLFISMNSGGKEDAISSIRRAFLHNFMDRYFPSAQEPVHLPATETAVDHAGLLQGRYWSSRRSHSGFLSAMNVAAQVKASANPDGTVIIDEFKDPSGAPFVFREVGPFLWQDATDQTTLAAQVRDGKIVSVASDQLPAILVFQPVPFWALASWNLPLLIGMAVVMLATLLLWPVQVIVRRHFGRRFALTGRRALLYRLARGTVIAGLLGLAAYGLAFSRFDSGNDPSDSLLRVAQLLCLVGAIGAPASVWNAVAVWTDRAADWWAKVSALLVMLACLAFVWFVVVLRLVTLELNY